MNRRDYETARMQFREVQLSYPYSRFAALSEFRVAETYYRGRAFATAIEAWRRFIRLHPSHELVPEATWRIARSHERQMPGQAFFMPPAYERDRTHAHQAVEAYRHFLDRFPEEERAEDARRRLAEVKDRLAAHELYVARFYMRRSQRQPEAALQRTDDLLRRYPRSTAVPEALFLGVRAALLLDDGAGALERLRLLREEHAETPWGRQAEEYMRTHGL